MNKIISMNDTSSEEFSFDDMFNYDYSDKTDSDDDLAPDVPLEEIDDAPNPSRSMLVALMIDTFRAKMAEDKKGFAGIWRFIDDHESAFSKAESLVEDAMAYLIRERASSANVNLAESSS